MGNYQTTESPEEIRRLKILNLSQKLTPEKYLQHLEGECVEGSLQQIPSEIIYYDSICMYEEISFSFNFITFVPEEFSLRVPHLRHLNISHNQITGLPNSFQLLLHLRVLDLSFNKIETFPEAVTHLKKLETLNVAHNLLSDLPTSIAYLKELQRLNLSHNHLRALSESLLECTNLRVIVTAGNGLVHPPQAICDQGSFSTLEYLSQKRIIRSEKISGVGSPTGVFTRVRGQQVMSSVVNPESASREYKQAQGTARTNKRKCPLMVPEDATSLAPDQLRESILGLVYGACIGDALGLNFEGLSEDECKFFYFNETFNLCDRISDLLRSRFPPGDWSSTTDIMLMSLDSLMRWGGVVDELELASQMVQWLVHGCPDIDPFPGHPLSPLLQQVIGSKDYVGHPHSVAESVYRRLIDEHNRGINAHVNHSDNSCLPGAVILGIPNFYKLNEVAMNAERICRATHASPLAVAASIFTAVVAAYLLQGKFQERNADIPALFEEIRCHVNASIPDDKTKAEFEKLLTEPLSDESSGRRSNDVLTTLKCIVSVLGCKDGFEELLSKFFTLGGEGLSANCCVLGGVLGAYFGYSNIPQKWLQQLPKDNKVWLNTKLNHLLDLFGLP